MLILYIAAGLIGLCFIYVLSACLYALVKLWKRPIRRVYQSVSTGDRFTPLDAMPESLLKTVVRLEDISFYAHHGYSLYTIRAHLKENLRKGRITGGGSTITQQLAKNLYFRFNKLYFRKLAELCVTFRLEKVLTKEQILELYLNVIYYGNDTWGIRQASSFYFDKEPTELTFDQSLFLITLLPAPTARNPLVHPDRFIKARNENLRLLTLSAIITEETAEDVKTKYTEAQPAGGLIRTAPRQIPPPMRNFYINPPKRRG